MANNLVVLLANNFKAWVSARGFIMVVAAALVPLILTGAWVATHQTDVAASDVSWDPDPAVDGTRINVTALIVNKGRFDVGAFNATITIGSVSPTSTGATLISQSTNRTRIEGLGAGESKQIFLNWTPRPGAFVVLADADNSDELGEIEEFNNQKLQWLEVRYKPANLSQAPRAPGNLTGPSGATGSADLAVTALDYPADPRSNTNITITATIRNNGPDAVTDANVTLHAGQVFSQQLFASRETKMNVSLGPGETTTVALAWNQVPPGPYWIESFVNATNIQDPDASNNHRADPFNVHVRVGEDAKFPDPPERLTIKRFYFDILNVLHLRILLPLIGLFYAAGVLSDEREKGNLVYLLTRPVPRPLIPITKFVASFLVASVAVVAGILGTFFLLLGTPQSDIGFLTTPLFISLISLFVYGSFFILLGVWFQRPYLIGLVWVIGWETIAGNFVPWVENLTLSHHLLTAFEGWWQVDEELHQPLLWLPKGTEALQALQWMVLAAVVFLVAAVVSMRVREFDE